MTSLIFGIAFALIYLIASISLLVKTWKANVASKKDTTYDYKSISFYDDEREIKKPTFSSKVANLDTHVSGAVRYNQSMYYGEQEFEKIKKEVLSKEFPMG